MAFLKLSFLVAFRDEGFAVQYTHSRIIGVEPVKPILLNRDRRTVVKHPKIVFLMQVGHLQQCLTPQ